MPTLSIPATPGFVSNTHTEESDAILYADMYQWLSASGTYSSDLDVGQTLITGRYYGMEVLIQFDTTQIPQEAVLDDITLSGRLKVDATTTDCVSEVYPYPGGTPTGFKKWIDFNTIVVGNRLATLSSVGIAVGPVSFVTESQTRMKAAINRKGDTWLLLASDRSRLLTVPAGDEYLTYDSAVGNILTLNIAYHIPSFPKATIAPMTMPSNPFRGGR